MFNTIIEIPSISDDGNNDNKKEIVWAQKPLFARICHIVIIISKQGYALNLRTDVADYIEPTFAYTVNISAPGYIPPLPTE